MKIIRNGEEIILTEQELEDAYEERKRMFIVEDAYRQLTDYYGTFDSEYADENCQHFLDLYGFSIDDAITEGSEHYILDSLVDRFMSKQDCNTPENEIWSFVISDFERTFLKNGGNDHE